MFKKLTTLLVALCCMVPMVMAQTMVVEPYGVSPRDASSDPADIFDRAFNGLLNVGSRPRCT